MNPESLVTISNAKVELYLATVESEKAFQFERQGYFCLDNQISAQDKAAGKLILNSTVGLYDTWAKITG